MNCYLKSKEPDVQEWRKEHSILLWTKSTDDIREPRLFFFFFNGGGIVS